MGEKDKAMMQYWLAGRRALDGERFIHVAMAASTLAKTPTIAGLVAAASGVGVVFPPQVPQTKHGHA